MSTLKSFFFVLFFSVGAFAAQPQWLIDSRTEGIHCDFCEAKNAPWAVQVKSENPIHPLGDLSAEFKRGKLLASETSKSENSLPGETEDSFKYFLLVDGRIAKAKEGFPRYLEVMSQISGKSIKQLEDELKEAKISTYELKSKLLSASIFSGKSLAQVKAIYQSAKPRENWINASLTAIAAVKDKPMADVEAQYEALKKKIKDPEARILLISATSFSDQSLDEVIANYNKIKNPNLAAEDKARLTMLAALSNRSVGQAVKSYEKNFAKTQEERNFAQIIANRTEDATVAVAAALFGKKTPSMAHYAKLDGMPVVINLTADLGAIESLLGSDDGGGSSYVHPNGEVYYRDGSPYGGTVYYDRDGRAYDSRPSIGDTLGNRLRGR